MPTVFLSYSREAFPSEWDKTMVGVDMAKNALANLK